MILTARDRRLRFLSFSLVWIVRLLLPCPSSAHAVILYNSLLLSRPSTSARTYVRTYTSTSLARSAKGLVHKFAIRENISADGQLRYREREKEERESRIDGEREEVHGEKVAGRETSEE